MDTQAAIYALLILNVFALFVNSFLVVKILALIAAWHRVTAYKLPDDNKTLDPEGEQILDLLASRQGYKNEP